MAIQFLKLESKINLLLEANTSISTISSTLEKPLSSIYNTILYIKKKKKLKDPILNRVKRGRVKKITPRAKKVINRDLTRSPKKENKRLLLKNNLGVTKRILQTLLKEKGYLVNISKKKRLLNEKKAENRDIYAKEQLKEKDLGLNKVIFSDKYSIQRGHGSRAEYHRKRRNKKLGKELVSSYLTSKFY